MKKGYRDSSNRGALLWFWQRISAIFLFAMLMFHFFSYHFVAQGSYEWKKVVFKMKSPWFNLLQFLFLLSALYHGLNGVWMIAEDYIHSRTGRMIVASAIVILGVSLLFIGSLTIVKISFLALDPITGGVK